VHEAIATLSHAVQLYPNDPRARRYMAYALMQARQPLASVKQFEYLAKLGGRTFDDDLGMAEALRQGGSYNQALRAYKHCVESGGATAKAYAGLARTYLDLGLVDKASEVCRAGLKEAKNTSEEKEFDSVLETIALSKNKPTENSTNSSSTNKTPARGDDGG